MHIRKGDESPQKHMNTRMFLCLCDSYFENACVTLKSPELQYVLKISTLKPTTDLISEGYLAKAFTFKT